MTFSLADTGARYAVAIWGSLFLILAVMADAATVPESHWAFQPLRPVKPPVEGASWPTTPIDRFILQKLETSKLKLSAPAGREQLIRRVSIGLIGLPPTPAEVDAFVNDPAPTAYERVIDRLLASPHYGERWARHWLDLARYAESDGFEHDTVRPHSWRYRDYVIRAFNQDKPFDRFVREQLAGDELWPDDPAALTATGFNLLGPDMVDSADQIQRRLNTLNDMTDTAASVFLGLTVGCARCHDHKFEPFTQRDYFSLQAFFAPADFRREHPVPTASERAKHETAMAAYNARTRVQRQEIEEMERPYREKLFDEKLSKLSEDVQIAHRTPKERRTMEQEGTVQETAPQVQVTDAEVTKALAKEDKARRASLETQLKKVSKPASLPLAMALRNTNGPPPKTCVLGRGDYNNPREEVQPAVPGVLARGTQPPVVPPLESQARRRALADWVASEDNPLTARVMVNRLWKYHFGRGLVGTPSDFGTQGQPPTHPELLDWLAGEFIRSGWSVKRMHKLLLLSATYQQSSAGAPEALARDPENRLLSRQNRLRLEGEVIRDSLLAISGRLNRQMGGPSISPPIAADITQTAKNWMASPNSADHYRRSIYVFARRNLRFPFLEVFDAPDSNLSCAERGRSTTAPQSLTLLNSQEVMDAAKATAARLTKEAKSDDERIELAFRAVLGRRPGQVELAMAREFINPRSSRREEALTSSETQNAKPGGAVSLLTPAPTNTEWSELYRALFNLNAFVYTD